MKPPDQQRSLVAHRSALAAGSVAQLEHLASRFAEDLRLGRSVTIAQYASEHPVLADEIRELFPVILAMEQSKQEREAATMRWQIPDDLHLERLGDCQIVREIGRGGMGVVFEGRRDPGEERVAVKWLPWRASAMSHRKERFEQEARTVAALRHPNIVPLLGVGEDDGYSFFVMQFIDGVSLDWVIRRLTVHETLRFNEEIVLRHQSSAPCHGCVSRAEDGSESGTKHGSQSRGAHASADNGDAGNSSVSSRGLRRNSWKLFARIGVQVAKALSHAHRQGVLHNDIKPGNLLLDAAGRVWVTDFGLAQPLDPPNDGEWRSVSGTLRYMAPERFSGRFDELSDLYSLGITLYELVTRRPAFEAADRKSLLRKIATSEPLAPRQIDGDIPRDLETIILTAVRRNPDERYYSVEALADDLLRFVNGQRIRARRPVFWRSWWPRVRRR